MSTDNNNEELLEQEIRENFLPLQLKMVREIELKRTARSQFKNSTVGKVSGTIYMLVASFSIFVLWRILGVNIFLSFILGIISWFLVTYIFDKILIKHSGIEETVRKSNEEELRASVERLKEMGLPVDDILK